MSKDYRIPEVSSRYSQLDVEGLETRDDDVFVVVTQAYDGRGNPLVHENAPTFDGFPGVSLWIELPDGRAGRVTLSPIHGDPRKAGFTDVADGTRCRISGFRGGPPLHRDERCVCGKGRYHRIYLTPQLEHGETILICDIWGCHRSRIIASSELLSWINY